MTLRHTCDSLKREPGKFSFHLREVFKNCIEFIEFF